jgi:hypothetical protein
LKAAAMNKYFQKIPTKTILHDALLAHEITMLSRWKATSDPSFWDATRNRNKTIDELLRDDITRARVTGAVSGSVNIDQIQYRAFPCYLCNGMFQAGYFAWLIHGTDWDLCGSKAEERICVDCGSTNGSEFWMDRLMGADVFVQELFTHSINNLHMMGCF